MWVLTAYWKRDPRHPYKAMLSGAVYLVVGIALMTFLLLGKAAREGGGSFAKGHKRIHSIRSL